MSLSGLPIMSRYPLRGGDFGPLMSSRIELVRAPGIRDQPYVLGTDRPPGPRQSPRGAVGDQRPVSVVRVGLPAL